MLLGQMMSGVDAAALSDHMVRFFHCAAHHYGGMSSAVWLHVTDWTTCGQQTTSWTPHLACMVRSQYLIPNLAALAQQVALPYSALASALDSFFFFNYLIFELLGFYD